MAGTPPAEDHQQHSLAVMFGAARPKNKGVMTKAPAAKPRGKAKLSGTQMTLTGQLVPPLALTDAGPPKARGKSKGKGKGKHPAALRTARKAASAAAPAEELPPQGAAALPPEPDDAASEAASGSEERGDEIGSELGVKQDELESAKRELEEEEAPPQGAVAKVENEERSPEAAAPQAEEEEAAQDDPPAGAPQVGEFVDVHGIEHSIVRCNRCCRTAKECNYRIRAKGQSTYQCDACNTNGVRLSRRFGQWPPKCFAKMKSEFKQQFYKDLAEDPGLSNLDRIEAFVVSSITVQRMEEERVRKGGKYLPLRKWAHDGFDAKKIEDNVQDKRWNPDLGEWTYRPQLEAAWSETVEAAVRNELYTDKRTQAKQSGPRAAASTGVAEHGGDKGDRSDESDMSRSRRRRRRRSDSRRRRRRSMSRRDSRGRRDSRSRRRDRRRDTNRSRSRSRGDRDRSKSRRKGRSKSRGKSKDRSKSRPFGGSTQGCRLGFAFVFGFRSTLQVRIGLLISLGSKCCHFRTTPKAPQG